MRDVLDLTLCSVLSCLRMQAGCVVFNAAAAEILLKGSSGSCCW
jgi:hypothetical protein